MTKQIDLLLISGFLGSGKTTILNYLLKKFIGIKCGVLVNEFGEINVDKERISSDREIQIEEVINGSILCSCRRDQFIEALIKLSNYELETIIIEASGITDPSTMLNELSIIEKKIGRIYNYKANICIVDARTFLDLRTVIVTLDNQITCATHIFINKIDLANKEIVKRIIRKLKDLNRAVLIQIGTFGQFDIKSLEEVSINSFKQQELNYKYKKSENAKPMKFSISSKNKISKIAFEMLINKYKTILLRSKGLIVTTDGFYDYDQSKNTYTLTKIEKETENKLVLIYNYDVEKEEKEKCEEEFKLLLYFPSLHGLVELLNGK